MAGGALEGTVNDRAHQPDVWLVGFGDSSLDFELVVWAGPDLITRPGRAEAAFLWAIEDELRAAGIEIPFPQRDLHVRSGTLSVKMESEAAARP